MKREGCLFDKIVSMENLRIAERNAGKGKANRSEVIKFRNKLESNLLKLHEALLSQDYRVSTYYHFTINEGKVRNISKLPYVDRVVQHALIIYLEPIFTKSFISQTYACIKGRGILKAANKLSEYLKDKENTCYVLKMDIKKFYPTVDNGILKELLRDKFKDRRLLNLLDKIIDSTEGKGLPLGAYSSQWLGNFYLNNLDHFIKEELKVKYLRYCDDSVILHKDKKVLHEIRRVIQEYLKINLKLELGKYQVFPSSKGIDYLGYVTYPDHRELRKSIKNNYVRMMVQNPNNKSIASYKGWLLHGSCVNLKRKYSQASPQ